MAEYGLPPGPHPDFEVDHLIPLGIWRPDAEANFGQSRAEASSRNGARRSRIGSNGSCMTSSAAAGRRGWGSTHDGGGLDRGIPDIFWRALIEKAAQPPASPSAAVLPNWRSALELLRRRWWKAYPYSNILPLLEGAAFDLLVADIRANGLLEPITIYEGLILDGRNRYRACEAAGVEPQFLEFDGDDPLAFVLSLNLHRRHLDESQRSMVAARLATMRQGTRTDLSPIGEKSQAEAAVLLNVGRRSVERARRLLITPRPNSSGPLTAATSACRWRRGWRPPLRRFKENGRRPEARPRPREAGGPSRARIRAGGEAIGVACEGLGVIYADPAWRFAPCARYRLDRRRNHYPTMALDAIKALDVASIAAPDSCCCCGRRRRCCPRRSRPWRHGASTTGRTSSGRRTAPAQATGRAISTSICWSASGATSRRRRWARNGRA